MFCTALLAAGVTCGPIDEITRLRNENGMAALARAERLLQARDYGGALDYYLDAASAIPTLAEAHQLAGWCHAIAGNHPSAVECFDLAHQHHPTNHNTLGYRGISHAALSHWDEADADLAAAIRLAPDEVHHYHDRVAVNVLRGGRMDAVIEDLTTILRLRPDDRKTRICRGQTYAMLGRNAEALADFTEAVRSSPGDGARYHDRSRCRYDLGDLSGATADATEAVRLAPDEPDHWHQRGLCHAAGGDHVRAVADYTAALERGRWNAYCHTSRGVSYMGLGQPGLALADFNEAIRLDPICGLCYANRGNVHLSAGRLAAGPTHLELLTG